MTALEPPADRVILRPHPPAEQTSFGLVLAEVAQEKSLYATVLAVGADLQPTDDGLPKLGVHRARDLAGLPLLRMMGPGDVVVMPRYGGTEIDWDGEVVVSILASELLAVVT